MLRGRTYTVRRGRHETVRQMTGAELPDLLREERGPHRLDDDLFQALGD